MGVQIHVNYSVSDTEYLEQSVNAQTHLLLLKFNRAWIDLHVYVAVGLSLNVQNVRLCMQTGMNEEVDISVVKMYQLVMANTKLQCVVQRRPHAGRVVIWCWGCMVLWISAPRRLYKPGAV